MADYSPVRQNGRNPFTKKASGTVTGGRLVMASGDGTVVNATALANTKVIGVAAYDAVNTDPNAGLVAVWPITGVEHEISCPGGAAAGDGVVAGDAGIAVKATGAGLATAAAAGTLLGLVTTGCSVNSASVVRFLGRG
jgi:hypothetical protein